MTRTDEAVTREREAEIRARLAQATPGEWRVIDDPYEARRNWRVIYAAGPVVDVSTYTRHYDDETENFAGVRIARADAELIANAPTDLADLLAEVGRLRADKERLADEWLANEWRPLRWLNAPQRAAVIRYAESLVADAIGEGERIAMDAAAPTSETTP